MTSARVRFKIVIKGEVIKACVKDPEDESLRKVQEKCWVKQLKPKIEADRSGKTDEATFLAHLNCGKGHYSLFFNKAQQHEYCCFGYQDSSCRSLIILEKQFCLRWFGEQCC
jgi:hypothetical protein